MGAPHFNINYEPWYKTITNIFDNCYFFIHVQRSKHEHQNWYPLNNMAIIYPTDCLQISYPIDCLLITIHPPPVMSHIVHSGDVGYSFGKIEQSNFGEPVLMMNILQKSESLQQTILLQNQGRFKFYFISNIDKLILGRSWKYPPNVDFTNRRQLRGIRENNPRFWAKSR